jgi:hypothetical protein
MNGKKTRKKVDHSGSTFDSFLEQEGIREEVETIAIKQVLQIAQSFGFQTLRLVSADWRYGGISGHDFSRAARTSPLIGLLAPVVVRMPGG